MANAHPVLPLWALLAAAPCRLPVGAASLAPVTVTFDRTNAWGGGYQANVNYLVALLRNHAFVAENPEDWLPWNYQESLAGLNLAV